MKTEEDMENVIKGNFNEQLTSKSTFEADCTD